MAEKITTINLLPHDGDTLINQVIDWALSIGRLLVILTEIVALATFIYRFSLDMQIVDFHDKIKSESYIIDNFQSQENTFRDIQTRLATAKQYTVVGKTTGTVFSSILNAGKGHITFVDLTVSTQNAKIVAAAQSPGGLSQFVNALKNNPQITSVSIDKVANDTTSAQIILTLTATLKPEPFASSTVTNANAGPAASQAVLSTQ